MSVDGRISTFCRDCMTANPGASAPSAGRRPRCVRCGSPRLVSHPELAALSLAHVDCDAFYATVEKRDNPELIDKPLIIGGGKRGVVATCCYIARINGVRSAMPMYKALEACPDAIVLKPDMEKYARVGRQVRALMEDLTPLVQPISIDEAFLDLAGTERLHGDVPARTLARFAARVESEVGITLSVGLSYCKFLAKVASDLEKPRGFSIIGRAEAVDFLADRPVSTIWGVGKAFEAQLQRDGVRTIGQLQTMELEALMRRYGVMGKRLYHFSRGEDERSVTPREGAKSISSETTFNTDLSRAADLVPQLRQLSEKVSARLKQSDLAGQTVVLKLKTTDFKLRSRSYKLDAPTRLADRIFRTGLFLLERELDGTRFRLLGIGVSDLTDPQQADPVDLVDPLAGRRAIAETAIDRVRARFGRTALETGYTFGHGKARDTPQDET
ncbi:DNA polymerase IV [Pseudohoeflea coraliihabitans]|uniref:DNA polymerase IV n=1 Tax=Pseudohoeflea coraliihabitans TaxID=2860393 RepID=A0ABS6WSH9_9HYPH|nr:DNA polymerase IV [Pseudohoeflea sp. DP4N28-3]MBW3098904.1 DNA polymerase IV [Pseudohoeflea sp. DP4N28-3]